MDRRLINDTPGELPFSEGNTAKEGVSLRFWLGFSCVFFTMLHSGYFGGFTSPVLSAECGASSASHGGSGGAGADDDVSCPECLNCELGLSVQVQGMLSAAPSLLGIPASLVGGLVVDFLGRRKALAIASLGVMCGWAIFFLAPKPHGAEAHRLTDGDLFSQATTETGLMLLGGRATSAVFSNIQVVAGTVWVSESSPPKIRGALMTCISFGWNFGALSIYGLGNVLFWRSLSIAGGVIGCVCFASSALVVESPRWLAPRYGMAAAERSLRALRPPNTHLAPTLQEIQENLKCAPRQQQYHAQSRDRGGGGGGEKAAAPCCMPILLATILMGSIPLSGVFVVFNFAREILAEIFPGDNNLASVVIPVAGAAGVLCVSYGTDRLGRKPMLLISCAGMFVCMGVLALYYHCHESGHWVGVSKHVWQWLAFLSLVLYMFFNQAGLGPLGAVVTTETVPDSVRGLAMGVGCAGGGLVGTASSYSLLPLTKSIGYANIFLGYALANVAIALFVLLCLTETAGKSLEQIQRGK